MRGKDKKLDRSRGKEMNRPKNIDIKCIHAYIYILHTWPYANERQSTPLLMLILKTNANQNYFKIPVFISQIGKH